MRGTSGPGATGRSGATGVPRPGPGSTAAAESAAGPPHRYAVVVPPHPGCHAQARVVVVSYAGTTPDGQLLYAEGTLTVRINGSVATPVEPGECPAGWQAWPLP